MSRAHVGRTFPPEFLLDTVSGFIDFIQRPAEKTEDPARAAMDLREALYPSMQEPIRAESSSPRRTGHPEILSCAHSGMEARRVISNNAKPG